MNFRLTPRFMAKQSPGCNKAQLKASIVARSVQLLIVSDTKVLLFKTTPCNQSRLEFM